MPDFEKLTRLGSAGVAVSLSTVVLILIRDQESTDLGTLCAFMVFNILIFAIHAYLTYKLCMRYDKRPDNDSENELGSLQ